MDFSGEVIFQWIVKIQSNMQCVNHCAPANILIKMSVNVCILLYFADVSCITHAFLKIAINRVTCL